MKALELNHQKEVMELRVQLEKANSLPTSVQNTGIPRIKIQLFNQEKDDIICYLSEFDAIAEHAGWTENSKVLQLRSLLTGEAREVSQQVTSEYKYLYKALLNRFGKRPADYFQLLKEIKHRPGETYRGLMSRIDLYLNRFIDEKDPIKTFREEYFLKELSPQQAQWIRRNKGTSEIVEAAEDYILPSKSSEDRKPQSHSARR
jgi:NTP pyrophosphatase (non-canonical NTP hydrolase)